MYLLSLNLVRFTWALARGADVLEENAEYVAHIFSQSIESLGGVAKIVGICTDNETTMRAAWAILEERFKGLLAIPCCAHVANLLLKDIAKMHWIDAVIKKAKDICSHIKSHTFTLALFKEKKNAYADCKGKELILPCQTRFGTYFSMLQRTLEFRDIFRELAVDRTYADSAYKDAEFCRTVLGDGFWEHVRDATGLMEPIFVFLRYVDQESPQMGEIYGKIRDIELKLQQLHTNDKQAALALFRQRLYGTTRKVPFHNAVHSAAMLLSPKNWQLNFPEKFGPDYANLRADLIMIIEKVSKSEQDAAVALLQYDNEYSNKTLGLFQLNLVKLSAEKGSPIAWWMQNGVELPELQYVAVRVLSLACSNSAAERNWSLHGFLHSKSRNRLSFPLQAKLVNVHSNLKLREKLAGMKSVKYYTDEEFGSESEEERA
jgi:hypothetical protein